MGILGNREYEKNGIFFDIGLIYGEGVKGKNSHVGARRVSWSGGGSWSGRSGMGQKKTTAFLHGRGVVPVVIILSG